MCNYAPSIAHDVAERCPPHYEGGSSGGHHAQKQGARRPPTQVTARNAVCCRLLRHVETLSPEIGRVERPVRKGSQRRPGM